MYYHIPSVPAEELSDQYAVFIGEDRVPVRKARVSAVPFNTWWPGHQRTLDQTEMSAFASFEMTEGEPLTVKVVCLKVGVGHVDIKPTCFGITPKVEGQVISFTLDRPRHFTVEINDVHHVLHVFVSPAKDYGVDKYANNVRYFGPGIHRAGLIRLYSGETLFIDEGAVVYGSVYARNADNIRVLGRGVLDAAIYSRNDIPDGNGNDRLVIRRELRRLNVRNACGNLLMENCHHVEIDGVIFRDPPEWSFNLYNCEDVLINDIKLIGLWRYNADGIDIYLGRRYEIANSFIRSFDDSVVARGACSPFDEDVFEDMNVHDCVLWCDWGRAIEIWTSQRTAHLKNIFFKDCQIIRTTHIAMDIQIYQSGPTYIDNVVCENIDVDTDEHGLRPVYQKNDTQLYQNTDDNYLPILCFVGNAYKFDAPYNPMGFQVDVHYSNILFRNIRVTGNRMPQSILKAIDGYMTLENIRFEGIFFNGKRLKSAKAMALDIEGEPDYSIR